VSYESHQQNPAICFPLLRIEIAGLSPIEVEQTSHAFNQGEVREHRLRQWFVEADQTGLVPLGLGEQERIRVAKCLADQVSAHDVDRDTEPLRSGHFLEQKD